jgi:quercetin dioxygenase-like cupin family protein
MPFHRFEGMESYRFNPHLSSATGPVLEGEYMYFRRVTKKAGSGATMHYHPNELMAFLLEGKVRCCVGSERRIVAPGTLVHMPPYAQHEFFATEEGDLTYLYIKDRTWTLIGAAIDEALPDEPLSANEVRKRIANGRYPGGEKAPEKSRAITDGLGRCYYPMLDPLDAPPASAHFERWVEGTHIAFGFVESPEGHSVSVPSAPHEIFLYVLSGGLAAQADSETREIAAGDVMHVPRGAAYGWTVAAEDGVRYAAVRSLPRLEAAIREHGAADNWRG